MLNVVRREAFVMRPTTRTKEDEEQQAADDPAVVESWQNWYPQEWIGWCLFGPPSGDCHDAWVNQSVSNGPEEVIPFEEGSRSSAKRPFGRAVQRERESHLKTTTKQTTDTITMQAKHFMQVDQELAMNKRLHDLATITMMEEVAVNDEERVSHFLYQLSLHRLLFDLLFIKSQAAARQMKRDLVIANFQNLRAQYPNSNQPMNPSQQSPDEPIPPRVTQSSPNVRFTPSLSGEVMGPSQPEFEVTQNVEYNEEQEDSAEKFLNDLSVGTFPSLTKNKYVGINWETLNAIMHKKYPILRPGVIQTRDLTMKDVNDDYNLLKALKENDVEDDPSLTMTALWISKLMKAMDTMKEKEDYDDFDDDDLFV